MVFALLLPWMVQCKPADKQTEVAAEAIEQTDSAYLAKGALIVQGTFDTLRSALLKTIGLSGVPGAVEYCNIHAYPITAHFADTFQVAIKRTSLKYRNPENMPDELETGMLQKWDESMNAGDTLVPVVFRDADDQVHYFQPIMVGELCLKCHGTAGTTMLISDYAVIQNKYPDDLATGYSTGDLRGMWHVVFKE